MTVRLSDYYAAWTWDKTLILIRLAYVVIVTKYAFGDLFRALRDCKREMAAIKKKQDGRALLNLLNSKRIGPPRVLEKI
jgi:hypothetical protein